MYIRRRSEVGHVQSASNTFSVFLLIPRPGHLIFDISAAKHYCLRAYSCVLEKKMHRRLRTVFCPDILGCIGFKKRRKRTQCLVSECALLAAFVSQIVCSLSWKEHFANHCICAAQPLVEFLCAVTVWEEDVFSTRSCARANVSVYVWLVDTERKKIRGRILNTFLSNVSQFGRKSIYYTTMCCTGNNQGH